MKTRRRTRHAFTLMEVLLVLAILVILGSLVTVSIVNVQKGSNIKSATIQINALEDALNSYHIDLNAYPTTSQGLQSLRTAPADLRNPQKWTRPYLDKEIPLDPWGNPYQYELVNADQFRLWSWGPDGQDGTEDDISNQ